MTPSQFSPFSEFILGARIVHFTLQLENLALQTVLLTRVRGDRSGEFEVENP